MDPSANPFAALSLIVAPAILTNASSLLAMSTSNRLARAVDRARDLAARIEREADGPSRVRHLRELNVAERRALILLRVLRSFYVALAGFAMAALLSLLGAVFTPTRQATVTGAFELLAIGAGVVAVAALVYGAALLIQETRMAVGILQERVASARALAGER